MKLKLITCAMLLAGACALGLTSCGNDNDDPKHETDRGSHTDVTSPEGFTFVAPEGVALRGFTSTAASYKVDFYDNGTADIHFRNVSLMADAAPGNIDVTAVPYTRKPDGSYTIDASNVAADGGIVKFREIEVFSARIDPTAVKDSNAAVFALNAETNDRTALTFIPYEIVAVGATEITSADSHFTSRETTYLVRVNPADGKGTVTVRNARFAENMPAVGDMVFDGLEVVYKEEGGYTLHSAKLIPTIAGVPYPSFAISNIMVDVELDSNDDTDISFMCNAMGRAYVVKAENLSYYALGGSR